VEGLEYPYSRTMDHLIEVMDVVNLKYCISILNKRESLSIVCVT